MKFIFILVFINDFNLCLGGARDFMQGSLNVHLPGGLKRGGQGQRRGVARGGHLEVAGVVVSSWVPNYGGPRGRGNNMGSVQGRGGMVSVAPVGPPQRNGPAYYPTRGGRTGRGGRRGAHQGTQRKTATASSSAITTTVTATQSNGKASTNGDNTENGR